MKLFIQKIKDVKWVEHSLLMAVLLNIIYLGGMLLIYKPFLSPDDYLMSETVYGVFGDDYDCHVKYMNFNYGRLIVQLLRWFPGIPWYTILFYVWVFLALTLISKIVLDKLPKVISYLMVNVILLYFSYEGYVCIQFTKVAGIIGAAGAMAILVSSSWMESILGMVLFVLSIYIRYDMTKMVIGSFFSMLVLMALIELVSKGKIKYDKKIYLKMVILGLLFFIIPRIPSYDASEKLYWNYYWQCNSNRSYIQDYELPDYEIYRDIYEKLNISRNDIYIWKSWNSDGQAMTSDRVNVLREINSGRITSENQLDNREFKDEDIRKAYEHYVNTSEQYKRNGHNTMVSFGMDRHTFETFYKSMKIYLKMENIKGFFKKFPKVFLTIDAAFAYLLCVILILFVSHRDHIFSLVAVGQPFIIGLLLNYYLYVHDRFLQHRVDVGIFFTLICLCVTLYKKQYMEEQGQKKDFLKKIFIVISAIMLITPYKVFGDDICAYGKEQLESNHTLIKYMSENKENRYLLTGTANAGSLWYRFYDTFAVPDRYGKNIFSGYGIGNVKRYQEHGINYVYSDIVDNDSIYLVLADNDTNEPAWEEYISKHSGKEVKLELQENIYGAKFYLVKSIDIS